MPQERNQPAAPPSFGPSPAGDTHPNPAPAAQPDFPALLLRDLDRALHDPRAVNRLVDNLGREQLGRGEPLAERDGAQDLAVRDVVREEGAELRGEGGAKVDLHAGKTEVRKKE